MTPARAREDLLATRKRLESRLAAIETDLSQALDDDSGERAVQTENDEVLAGMQQSAREELKAVAAAIARIDAGTYGLCVLCAAPIGDERLTALPYAALCIGCATNADRGAT